MDKIDITGHGKSISCQENTYLLELVRYIHFHPIKFPGENPI